MHLRRANINDLPDAAACFRGAFETDRLSDYLHPYRHEYPDSHRRWSLDDLKRRYLAPGSVVMVAETDPGDVGADGKKKVVGSAFWRRWGVEEAALQQQREQETYLQSMLEWFISHFLIKGVKHRFW